MEPRSPAPVVRPQPPARLPWLTGLGVGALLLALWLVPQWRQRTRAGGPVEVPRSELERRAGRLHRRGAPEPFTGVMIERYPDGTLKSRSEVVDGRLEGLSEGWHPNGRLAIREHFHAGVSEGLRVRWRADGSKLSEAMVVAGRLEGLFRRWHPNGVLAEEAPMHENRPHGRARAWYPSGFLRSVAVTEAGRVVREEHWPDFTRREDPALAAGASPAR